MVYSWIFMRNRGLAAAFAAALFVLGGRPAAADDAQPLLRVFLTDGSALVSFGEPARVGDRVVFSMPTAVGPKAPMQLVTIPAVRVDWERTNRYSATARATRYLDTQAETDYAALSNEISQTLSEVTLAKDAGQRLALAERARKMLSEWPASHYSYRQNEVRQMLTMLDEAIADLRVIATPGRFDLTLTAFVEPPPVPHEPVLPPPTPKQLVEQAKNVARLVDSSVERTALLATVVATVVREKATLPADFVKATRTEAEAQLLVERRTDRVYQRLAKWIMPAAERNARAGNVLSLEALLKRIEQRDRALGGRRPEAVAALVAAVQAKLDAARQLQLARDRWQLRAAAYREYKAAMKRPMDLLAQLKRPLENIKSLSGSSAAGLTALHLSSARIAALANAVSPPAELVGAHALLVSATQLAANAAQIRREAALAGDMARAWDASSAAAGALMLVDRAKNDIQSVLRPPQLK
jgi:hypothetical protein